MRRAGQLRADALLDGVAIVGVNGFSSPDALMRVLDARGPCVSTAPMPAARLHSADSMPVREIDSASVPRMPVARVVPCYLADSIR